MDLTYREKIIKNNMNRDLGFNVIFPDLKTINGETPLMLVNFTNDPLNYTKSLIKMGANPNITEQENGTALHYVVANQNPDTLEYLLSVGANPFLKDGDGFTPYDLALYYNHTIEAHILKDHMIRKIQNKQLRRMTHRRARTMRRLATAKSMLDDNSIDNPMSYIDYDTMTHLTKNYL